MVFVGGDQAGIIKPRNKFGMKGQELVEFSIMLPLLLFVLIAIIDLGRVFHASITIANASRAGAVSYTHLTLPTILLV